MEKKKSYIIVLVLIIVSMLIMVFMLFSYNKKDNNPKVKNIKTNDNYVQSNNIITFEEQTSQDIENSDGQYYIDSEKALNTFYDNYNIELNINKKYIKNSIILIKVKGTNSGSNEFSLEDIEYDSNNKINFNIKDKTEGMFGTMDMATWYFVAIIPKDELTNADFSDWKKPNNKVVWSD